MKTLVDADIHDIHSGRGNFINGCSGNKKFRELVKQIKTEYVATDKKKKKEFTQVLVASLKSLDPPAKFLGKEQNNRYLELSDKEAIVKARQALREGAPEIEKGLKNGTIVVEEFDFAALIKAKIELVYKQGRCVAEEHEIPNQSSRPKVSEAQQIEAIKNAAAAMCTSNADCQNPEKGQINISPIKPISIHIHTPHLPEERYEPCPSRKSTESETQIGSEIEFLLQNDNAVSESTIPTNNLYRDTQNNRDFYSNLRPKMNLTLSNPFAQRQHEQQGQQDHYNFYSNPEQLDRRQLYVKFPPQGHSVQSDKRYVDHQSCTFQSQCQRYTTQQETYSGSQMQQGREYVEIDEDLLSCSSLASKLSLNDDGSWLRSSNNSGKMSLASKKTITSADLFRYNFIGVGDASMNSDLKDDSLHNLQDPLQNGTNARNETLLQGNADLTSALHGDETAANICNDRARTLSLLNNVLEPKKDWTMNGDDDIQSLGSISTFGQDEINLENNTHIYNLDMLHDLELKFGSSVSKGAYI